jgi:hypothetical protein
MAMAALYIIWGSLIWPDRDGPLELVNAEAYLTQLLASDLVGTSRLVSSPEKLIQLVECHRDVHV